MVARRTALSFLIALMVATAARGATIYAFARDAGHVDHRLLRFDSASPWDLERSLPIDGAIDEFTEVSLEFDPVTADLYGFGFWQCQVTCPAIATDPMRIDPLTGDLSHLDWPGLPQIEFAPSDKDIDPQTHELRLFSQSGGNFRYSLDSLALHVDPALDLPGYAFAIAHKRPAEGGGGVETFAIFWEYENGIQLARIGEAGGAPPASSGTVTLIGPVDVRGRIVGFDISESGEAFLSTYDDIERSRDDHRSYASWLYAIDLETGETQELGTIATPPGSYVSGIAVAPPHRTAGAPEIPALSHIGLLALSLLLASAALWRSRSGLS